MHWFVRTKHLVLHWLKSWISLYLTLLEGDDDCFANDVMCELSLSLLLVRSLSPMLMLTPNTRTAPALTDSRGAAYRGNGHEPGARLKRAQPPG